MDDDEETVDFGKIKDLFKRKKASSEVKEDEKEEIKESVHKTFRITF